jgi:uncharacterized protein (TIGR03118 family)
MSKFDGFHAIRVGPWAAPIVLAAAFIAGCGGSGYGGGGGSKPTLTIGVQPATVAVGQTATLTWTAASGTTCTASGAWAGTQAATGTQVVTATEVGTENFTLACSGGSYNGAVSMTAVLTVTAPSAYSTTSLVTDVADGSALTTDGNLLNAWGVAVGPTSPVWVANNHSDTSTLYDGNGKPQPADQPVIVELPTNAAGTSFDPTGIVFNGTNDFVVTRDNQSGPARFIFDGEGGMIAGWSSAVDLHSAVITYVDQGGASYTGLAIANNGSGNFLYATDFANRKIDVFNATFQKQPVTADSFTFVDPDLPADYAPFGIQAIANGPNNSVQLYVAYARQEGPDNPDEVVGDGLGLVAVYDANGHFVKRLVSNGGKLNAPWGMALAPPDFGTLSDALLVGNFGDGRVNGFDPATGAFLGTIVNAQGQPFAVPGLWGITFGNGVANQARNTLFYAAGTNGEENGAYGRIDVGATPPVLNAPPVVTVTGLAGTVSGTVALTATATADVAVRSVEYFLNGTTSLGVAAPAPYTVQWDTTQVANGNVQITATATDVDGNVGTSPPVTVTVANGPAAPTLTMIQAQVFTPRCAVCHDGSNAPDGALPGSQNLTTGNSFASLVNVPSKEQPGVLRVKPGDPANSYLIRKLEGTAGIDGSRMPLGGPFLDQAAIDQIKAWIAAGAQNN